MTYTTKKALSVGYIEDHGCRQMAIYTAKGVLWAFVTKLAVLEDGQIVLRHRHGYGDGLRFSVVKPDTDHVPVDERPFASSDAYAVHVFRTTAEWGPDADADERN